MPKTFFLGFVLVLLGGAVLWYIAFRPDMPQFSMAQAPDSQQLSTELQTEVTRIDQQIAQKIREVGKNGIDWDAITSPTQLSESIEKVSQATVSATVSTTPEELWTTLREQGSQAVLTTLAKNAEVSVNTVSADIVNEARYQYCVGVVNQYEELQKTP